MFFLLSVLAVGSFAHLSHSKAINGTTGPALDLSNEQYSSRSYPVPSLGDCFNSIGLLECLKSVTLRSLNKAINSDGSFRVTRFLVVKKNPDYNLVQVDERTPYDWYTIILRIRDFISSRIFQFSLADPEGRSLIPLGFEGRGKKHKHKHQGGFYMMGGVAFMAMVAQLVLGKVALLAAVALIMAKIALVFSTLVNNLGFLYHMILSSQGYR